MTAGDGGEGFYITEMGGRSYLLVAPRGEGKLTAPTHCGGLPGPIVGTSMART